MAPGPLSTDLYLSALLLGLVLYLLSSVACMLASSVDALIASRFFQAPAPWAALASYFFFVRPAAG